MNITLSPNQIVLHTSVSDHLWLGRVTDRRLDYEGIRSLLGAYRSSCVVYGRNGVIGGFVGILLTWRSESDLTRVLIEYDLEPETDIQEIVEI
jgi:hypothetical protein